MVQVQEVDEPDLALRLAEGLRERPEAAITTQNPLHAPEPAWTCLKRTIPPCACMHAFVSSGHAPPTSSAHTQAAEGNIYSSAASFEELNLSPELLKGLYVEMKFERPSRIQASTLPMILTPPHRDLIAQVCCLLHQRTNAEQECVLIV
eukprot:1136212-Pelagomonas_calceolata.AAC.4